MRRGPDQDLQRRRLGATPQNGEFLPARHRQVAVASVYAVCMKWLTVVFPLCLASPALTQDMLAPLHLAKDDRTSFDLNSSTRIGMGPAGGVTDLTLHIELHVLAIEDTGTRVRITWKDTSGEVVVPMLTARFDTRKQVESAIPAGHGKLADWLARGIVTDMTKPYEALAGFSYEAVLDSCGRIVALPGLGDCLDALRAKVGRCPNADTVNSLCDERTIRWQIGLLVPTRAEGPTQPGSTWDDAHTVGLGNSPLAVVDVRVRHELAQVSGDRATITLAGTPTIPGGRTQAVDASLEGKQVVNTDDGLTESAWVALDCNLRHKGKSKLLDQDVECDWTVARIR